MAGKVVQNHSIQKYLSAYHLLLHFLSILDAVIGSEVAQVTANDVDSGPPLWYVLSVDGFPGGTFSIFRYGGQIWLTEPLDYEERTSYTLTIQTSDGKHQSRADIRLLLQDINDNAPEFRQSLYQVDVTKSMTQIEGAPRPFLMTSLKWLVTVQGW